MVQISRNHIVWQVIERLQKSSLTDKLQFFEKKYGSLYAEEVRAQLTHHDLEILTLILGKEVMISDIVNQMSITQGGVSRRIKKLNELGYLERFRGLENYRNVYVKLTSKGEHLAKANLAFHESAYERVKQDFSSFSQDELNTIERFLNIVQKYGEFGE
ncbi:winged helix DNA-binding protein [Holzapfeliella sp. He02]|uniref:Winged helix DNA-binding protein n=1 Tax=Holzapfeliella saturejae TaxID=3082953 RepID=A0ABU8SEI9_9LACO